MTSLSTFNKTESQLIQYLSLCLGQSDKTHTIPPLTANEWVYISFTLSTLHGIFEPSRRLY